MAVDSPSLAIDTSDSECAPSEASGSACEEELNEGMAASLDAAREVKPSPAKKQHRVPAQTKPRKVTQEIRRRFPASFQDVASASVLLAPPPPVQVPILAHWASRPASIVESPISDWAALFDVGPLTVAVAASEQEHPLEDVEQLHAGPLPDETPGWVLNAGLPVGGIVWCSAPPLTGSGSADRQHVVAFTISATDTCDPGVTLEGGTSTLQVWSLGGLNTSGDSTLPWLACALLTDAHILAISTCPTTAWHSEGIAEGTPATDSRDALCLLAATCADGKATGSSPSQHARALFALGHCSAPAKFPFAFLTIYGGLHHVEPSRLEANFSRRGVIAGYHLRAAHFCRRRQDLCGAGRGSKGVGGPRPSRATVVSEDRTAGAATWRHDPMS